LVHLNAHEDVPVVANEPHQHAFVIVGDQTRFAVHMTQFHCELHKYQLIYEFDIGDKDGELARLRRDYPDEALFLCNDDPTAHWFSIPALASGRVTEFHGNIFVGLRRPPPVPPPHFFPWKKDRAKPAVADVTVKVRRIVHFRPFAHHESLPPYATFLLFGKGDEVHMTNKQVAALATGPFQPAAFGPDVDFVMSLAERPAWLVDDAILEAGLVMSAPGFPNRDPATGAPTTPCKTRFPKGDRVPMLYRGTGPAREINAGPTFMTCTAVVNSPSMVPCKDDTMWGIFEMPKKYWGKSD
jgi:hypothetical protein